MKKEEIIGCDWVSIAFQLKEIGIDSISLAEQECHINVIKEDEQTSQPEAIVSCSYQKWITKFSKNPNFMLTEVLVSKSTNAVLAIKGRLNPKAVSIRKALLKSHITPQTARINAISQLKGEE